MGLSVSAKLFCGAELDFSTTDEMDEDYEKHYSQEGVYAREVARSLGYETEEDFDEESLAEQIGLRVLYLTNAVYLAVESTVNEIGGNGEHRVDVSPPKASDYSLLVHALKAMDNSKTGPEWLMVTDYS